MPKIKINDNNFYYEIHGSGTPLVLVAGFSADHMIWGPIIKALANDYKVLIFDNRGAGQSDCPLYPYTIDMMASDTVALCDALGFKTAHFLGNSMGGAIVQNIAYKYPEYVSSAILSNTFIDINIRLQLQIEAYIELRNANVPLKHLLKLIISDVYSREFLSKDNVPDFLIKTILSNQFPITNEGYKNQANALFEFSSSKWLHKVKCPCFVIYSDDDLLVDIESSKKVIAALPQAETFCFHNVGHLPFIENPALFVEIVNNFIRSY